MNYFKTVVFATLITSIFSFSIGGNAAKPTYAETLKTTSNAGLVYELARQVKNTTDACGYKVAEYVWQSAGKNRSWESIAPQIQKIQESKECKSSAQDLKFVSDEISKRNSAFLKYWAGRLFPKINSDTGLDQIQGPKPEEHINRADKVQPYDWTGHEVCSINLIQKGLQESMERALYQQSDGGVGYYDKTQLISDEPIRISKLGQKSFYGRVFQEFSVTFKTRKGEEFKVVTIDNSNGSVVGDVLLIGPVDIERSEHGLDLQYCIANYLARVSQHDDTKLSNAPEERKHRYFSVGDKRYSMSVRSTSSGLPYGGRDWDNFSDSASSVAVGNLGKITETLKNRHY